MYRILIITRNLPPLLGGMERLNWHLAQQLATTDEVRVIGPSGASKFAPAGVMIKEARLRPLLAFFFSACWRGSREALRWRPSIVLAGSGLTAPIAWLVGRCCGARVVVYVHGLDIAVPSRIYQALWIPALLRADHIIANSHATAELAIQVGARAERIGIVHPGVSVPEELQREAASGRFRQKHGLPSSPVLLSVGRLTRRKGLREFITDVLPQVAKSRPGVLLLIVGDTEATALYGAESRESLEIAAKAVGMAENIRFLGKLGEEELEDAYCAADVHVFPIRELPGDPEGFGMVAIEAAAHGLPTVAYSNGGVVDAVRDGVSGRLVAPLDAEGFAGAILQCLTEPLEPAAMRVFASRFEWLEFGRAVRKELAEISVRTDIS